jgi:ketosteroid isomerase-like protein
VVADSAAALGGLDGVVLNVGIGLGRGATGKTAAMDLHHYFRFRDGKIAYYRGTEDTAQTQAVLQA